MHHIVGDANGNGIAHHACHGSLCASGNMARWNMVGSVQEHSMVSLPQMLSSVPSYLSISVHIL